MRIVDTARILLFDAENRLLLFKYQEPGQEPFWGTIGGRLESSETPHDTARRELLEETGLSDAVAETVVWHLEHEMIRGGEPCRLQETFFVARTAQNKLDHSRWTDAERKIIVDTQWWRVDDIEGSDEAIYPVELRQVIRSISAGTYAQP